MGELIAKAKFWFGQTEPIFDTNKYKVECVGTYVYVYEKDAE